jgi:hypothetical protein
MSPFLKFFLGRTVWRGDERFAVFFEGVLGKVGVLVW